MTKISQMNLDIDLEILRNKVRTIRKNVSATHAQGKVLKEKYDLLKESRKLNEAKLGWREKFVMGYLGGDRSSVKRAKEIEVALLLTKNRLKEIDHTLKSENNKLNEEVKKYVIDHSIFYSVLTKEYTQYARLLESSVSFQNLLLQAKKSISDALAFISWENLINHPRAKKELGKFFSRVEEYQQTMSSVESILNISLKKDSDFKGLIKFSSKKLAMESFNKMNSQLLANIDYAEAMCREKSNSINSFLTRVTQAL